MKAHVLQVSSVKQIQTHNQGALKKQEVVLADTTNWIKLDLWQKYVNTLTKGTTYTLENLRQKKFNNERYLNTAKVEEFKFEESENFSDSLVQPDQPLYQETTLPDCQVIGVTEATKTLCCVSCSKKCIFRPDSSLVQCTSNSCKLMQKVELCKSQWYLRIMVKDNAPPEKKFMLTLFHSQVQQLIDRMYLELDLASSTEEKVLIAILSSKKMISVTFDPLSHNVSSVASMPEKPSKEL